MDRRISKERLISKIIKSPLTYVILILLFLIFAYSAINTYQKSRIAKEKTRQVEESLRKLEEQEQNLKNSLNDMNTPFGVEKSLREKFGIIRSGEESIIIVDSLEVLTPESLQKDENTGIFGFLKNIF